METKHQDRLSVKIRCCNSTPAEDKVADAAPELLAACVAAEKIIGDLHDNGVRPSIRKAWEELRAAIAKATH